jgi:betaine reductase
VRTPCLPQAGERTVNIPKEVKIVFQGKKVIVIGERDGVPGPAIARCLSSAGAEIVYTTTECFV